MSQQPLNEDVQAVAERVKQEVTASRRPWYHLSRTARILLLIYAVQLTLFGALAWKERKMPTTSFALMGLRGSSRFS